MSSMLSVFDMNLFHGMELDFLEKIDGNFPGEKLPRRLEDTSHRDGLVTGVLGCCGADFAPADP